MKEGRSLQDLAKELERQAKEKRDFKSPTRLITLERLRFEPEEGTESRDFRLKLGGNGLDMMHLPQNGFKLNSLAHTQLRTWAKIPAKYYDLMWEKDPALLTTNVNKWLHRADETRLIRTLDNHARAFLSNRYRCIDNFDVAQTVLPILLEDPQLKIISCEVTENRLYFKAVTEKLTFEVDVGDVVQAGIVISNSEVGLGSVAVEPLLYRLVCKNGAIISDRAMRKYHVGRHHQNLDELTELFRDETRKANDQAFLMKLQDITRAAFDQVQFDQVKNIAIDAHTRKIEAGPNQVLDRVTETFGLKKDETEGVLQALISGSGRDQTQWGLANAVTSVANTTEDYERATELEKIGGRILTLSASKWKALADADVDAA